MQTSVYQLVMKAEQIAIWDFGLRSFLYLQIVGAIFKTIAVAAASVTPF